MFSSDFCFDKSEQFSVTMLFNVKNIIVFCNGIIDHLFFEKNFKPFATEKLLSKTMTLIQ